MCCCGPTDVAPVWVWDEGVVREYGIGGWTWVFTVAGSPCAVVADQNEADVLGSISVQPRLHRDTHYVDRDELHEDMKGKPRTPPLLRRRDRRETERVGVVPNKGI